jgi:hypothetical protein
MAEPATSMNLPTEAITYIVDDPKLFSIQIGMPKFLKGSRQQGRGNGEYPI